MKLKKVLHLVIPIATAIVSGVIFYKLGHYDGLTDGRRENELIDRNSRKVIGMVVDKTVEKTCRMMELWLPETGTLTQNLLKGKPNAQIRWSNFIPKYRNSLKCDFKKGTISYINQDGLRETIDDFSYFS